MTHGEPTRFCSERVNYVTHDGRWHMDEIFAIELLRLVFAEGTTTRTRLTNESYQGPVIYLDVGKCDNSDELSPLRVKRGSVLRIDHHQDENTTRSTFERVLKWCERWLMIGISEPLRHLAQIVSEGDIRPEGDASQIYRFLRDICSAGDFQWASIVAARMIKKYWEPADLEGQGVFAKTRMVGDMEVTIRVVMGIYAERGWWDPFKRNTLTMIIPCYQEEGLLIVLSGDRVKVDQMKDQMEMILSSIPNRVADELDIPVWNLPYSVIFSLKRELIGIGPEKKIVGNQKVIDDWIIDVYNGTRHFDK